MEFLQVGVLVFGFIIQCYGQNPLSKQCEGVRCPQILCIEGYVPYYSPGSCCQSICKPAPGGKPGVCPTPTDAGICISSCGSDGDCQGDKKCCSNGCGQVCIDPVPSCSEAHCDLLTCERQHKPTGQCCPRCKGPRD